MVKPEEGEDPIEPSYWVTPKYPGNVIPPDVLAPDPVSLDAMVTVSVVFVGRVVT